MCLLVVTYVIQKEHIAASHTHDSFSEFLNLKIDNFCIYLFYWLDKSSKGKDKLTEYFEFCDQEQKSILKHVSVNWVIFGTLHERNFT